MSISSGNHPAFMSPARNCGRAAMAAGAALAMVLLSACANEVPPPAAAATDNSLPTGPRISGTYPNLNIPPRVAAPQFADKERSDEVKSLRAVQKAQAKQAAGNKVRDERRELNALGRTHGPAALKEIGQGD